MRTVAGAERQEPSGPSALDKPDIFHKKKFKRQAGNREHRLLDTMVPVTYVVLVPEFFYLLCKTLPPWACSSRRSRPPRGSRAAPRSQREVGRARRTHSAGGRTQHGSESASPYTPSRLTFCLHFKSRSNSYNTREGRHPTMLSSRERKSRSGLSVD